MGSFTTKRNIILNPELVQAAKACIVYVIIHELCYLSQKPHQSLLGPTKQRNARLGKAENKVGEVYGLMMFK